MTRIPKILHYTFGMARDFGGKPWSLVHHVCLMSAVERIKPEKIYFHCQYEPSGPWWSLSRDFVTVNRLAAPRQIYGRPLVHVAHRSDVVRLQKLVEHGGIYLDADIFVHRGFDDLLSHSTVMGLEGESGEHGMANAVILAEPGAPFLRRWLEEYRSFRSRGRDEYWNEHSVQLPVRLARAHPRDVTILSHKAFFWPLWTDDHLEWLFRSNRPIPGAETYANHLWESNAWKYLEGLTPGQVRAHDTNFHRWAAPFLAGLPDDYGAPQIWDRLRSLQYKAARKTSSKLEGARRRAGALAGPVLSRLRPRTHANDSDVRRQAFQTVYQQKLWGGDSVSKFYSGVGSRGEALQVYAQQMGELLGRISAELGHPPTVIDLGCGDFQVGHALLQRLPEMTYVGCDIVPELIAHNKARHATAKVRFRQLDLVSDALPQGDVCLVRQVLQHLSNADIAAFLARADYRWLYVTEGHPARRSGPFNPDKTVGHDVRFDWRTGCGRGVELDRPPYGAKTEEMFRVAAPPHEVIVTERVFPPGGASPMEMALAEDQRSIA